MASAKTTREMTRYPWCTIKERKSLMGSSVKTSTQLSHWTTTAANGTPGHPPLGRAQTCVGWSKVLIFADVACRVGASNNSSWPVLSRCFPASGSTRPKRSPPMSHVSQPAAVQVEYDPKKPRISLNRIFQIPNMFRPAFSSFYGNTIGRVNLERPAIGLTAVASWFRFARWRRMYPVARPADPKRRLDRTWLYETVIEKEGLTNAPLDYW